MGVRELDFNRDSQASSKLLAGFLLTDPARGQGYLSMAKYQYSTISFLSVLDEYDRDIVSAIACLEQGREEAWQSLVQWLQQYSAARQHQFFSLGLTWGLVNQDNDWLSCVWETGSEEIHSYLSDIIPFGVSKFPSLSALLPVAGLLVSRVIDQNVDKLNRSDALVGLECMFQWAGPAVLDHIEPTAQITLLKKLHQLPLLDYPALRSFTLRSQLSHLACPVHVASPLPQM